MGHVDPCPGTWKYIEMDYECSGTWLFYDIIHIVKKSCYTAPCSGKGEIENVTDVFNFSSDTRA